MKKTLISIAAVMMTLMPLAAQTGEKKMNKVIVDPKIGSPFNKGVFQGWGTSFCWWPNRIGYSDELAKKAAELFYSEEKGLGMNIIRYNVGGGDDPSHNHITRTDSDMPGFMVKDEATGNFVYDWNADHNQRNVLKEAVKACGQGVIVEAFSNSPPYFMTKSGCSSGNEDASKDNLREDKYDEFADYMATVMEHLQESDGIKFQSCAPMNEPATSYWGAMSWKQEGCHFDIGESQSKMTVAMAKALKNHGLNNVILTATDETSIDTARYAYRMLSKEAKKSVKRIDTHAYQGDARDSLKNLAVKEKKNLWMSEVDGGDVRGTNAGEMGAALWIAEAILKDMNNMMPSAWIMWQAIDQHKCAVQYKGRNDWYAKDRTGGYWGLAIADHDELDIILTKKYYAYGQFSKFIRPGSKILESSPNTLAAFDPNKNQVIIVAVNYNDTGIDYSFDLSAFKKLGTEAKAWRSSGSCAEGENISPIDAVKLNGKNLEVSLIPNSITTYVIQN